MKTFEGKGGGVIAPLTSVLTLAIGEVHVSFMALLHFTEGKSSWYPLIRTYDVQIV